MKFSITFDHLLPAVLTGVTLIIKFLGAKVSNSFYISKCFSLFLCFLHNVLYFIKKKRLFLIRFHIIKQLQSPVELLLVPLVHVVESVTYAVLLLGCSARQLHGAIGHVYLQCIPMRYASHVEILDDVLRVHMVKHLEEILLVDVDIHPSAFPLVVRRLRLLHLHIGDATMV